MAEFLVISYGNFLLLFKLFRIKKFEKKDSFLKKNGHFYYLLHVS